MALTRDGDDVPGRVADDLFWLGRYTERTEGGARLLREVLLRLLGSERTPQDESLSPLLRAVTYQTGTLPGFVGEGADERLRGTGARAAQRHPRPQARRQPALQHRCTGPRRPLRPRPFVDAIRHA